MSDITKQTPAEHTYVVPWAATILLAVLACGWGLTFLLSASEPSIAAALIGIPIFLATPVVSLVFLRLLRRRRAHSVFHRAAFYCSALFFAAWAVFALVGLLTK